jgi:hypothetical protein
MMQINRKKVIISHHKITRRQTRPQKLHKMLELFQMEARMMQQGPLLKRKIQHHKKEIVWAILSLQN